MPNTIHPAGMEKAWCHLGTERSEPLNSPAAGTKKQSFIVPITAGLCLSIRKYNCLLFSNQACLVLFFNYPIFTPNAIFSFLQQK